jgi:hypothetical protein
LTVIWSRSTAMGGDGVGGGSGDEEPDAVGE